MDKKTAVHIAAETIVVGSLTAYLINRIGALENRVIELERNLQATAKHAVSTEKKQTEVLNAMGHLIKSNVRPGSLSTSAHTDPDHRFRGNHTVKHTVHPVVSSSKKKVSFSDADDEDRDDETSDNEEPAPVVKPKAKKKGIKVSAPIQNNTNSRKDMSAVRDEAAKLAPSEDN